MEKQQGRRHLRDIAPQLLLVPEQLELQVVALAGVVVAGERAVAVLRVHLDRPLPTLAALRFVWI
jgi:hypothetical protein